MCRQKGQLGRSSHWWEHVVKSTFTQNWLENFRMSQSTFMYLCDELRSSTERNNTRVVPTEMRVAITLCVLATGFDYGTTSHLFGVPKSTVCLVSKYVFCHCEEPTASLRKIFNALKEIVDGFKVILAFLSESMDHTSQSSLPS